MEKGQSMMILLMPIIGLALWILSIYLVRKWKYFWAYFFINLLIVISYLIYILYGSLTFLGHDEYGLGRLFLLFSWPIKHAILGAVIAIIINRKITKNPTIYN